MRGNTRQGISIGEAVVALKERAGEDVSPSIANSAIEPWGPLVSPGSDASGPAFPVDALPPALRQWTVDVAEAFQVPSDLPASLALGALASVAQHGFRVQPGRNWSMPACLFVTIAMPSGTRKSPVFELAMRPIAAAEKEERRKATRERRTAEHRKHALDKALEKAVELSLSDPTANAEVSRLEAELHSHKVAPIPMLLVADSTPEAISNHLAEQGGHLTVASPEGELFDILAGRYSDTPAIEVFLKSYSGDDIRVARARREPIYIEKPSLTMVLAVQPAVLREAAGNPRFRNRGLLARFLAAVPPDTLGSRRTNPEPVPESVLNAYDSLITYVWIASKKGAMTEDTLTLRFSDEARLWLAGFETELEPHLLPTGDLRHVSDWVAKLPGQVARIAGLLHLAAGRTADSFVEAETVAAAVEIGRYFLDHQLIIFPRGPHQHTQFVLERLIDLHPVSVRDLFERVKGTVHTTHELRTVLRDLQARNYVRLVRPTGRVGRPSERVQLNPALDSQNSQNSGGNAVTAEPSTTTASLCRQGDADEHEDSQPPEVEMQTQSSDKEATRTAPRARVQSVERRNTTGSVIGSNAQMLAAIKWAKKHPPKPGSRVIGSRHDMLSAIEHAQEILAPVRRRKAD